MTRRRPFLAGTLSLLLLACGGADDATESPAAPTPATDQQLGRHYEARLDRSYWTVRVDGLRGLGHLGPAASRTIPALVERTEGPGAFEELVALWALAEIDTARSTPVLGERADLERQRLQEGDLPVVAARTAFLAAVHDEDPPPRFLDRALAELYSAARGQRGERRGQRFLAAWALHEIGTRVTREAADEGLRRAAETLDAGDAAYGRQLVYVRLVGRPAREALTEPLRRILSSYDFGSSLDRDRVQTLYTLVALHRPDLPAEVAAFRQQLAEGLADPLRDDRSIRALLTIGPHGCSAGAPAGLRELLRRADDNTDRAQARRGLEMCGGR